MHQKKTACYYRLGKVLRGPGVLFTMGLLALVGCAHRDQQQEISRHPSPDYASEAVVVRYSGTPSMCAVYLTLPGASIGKGSQVFKGTEVEGLAVRWLSASRLEIRFRAAHVEHFHPVWEEFGRSVRIWMIEEHDQDAALSKDTRSSITSCS